MAGMTREQVQNVLRNIEHEILSRPHGFFASLTLEDLLVEIAHTVLHEYQENT